MRYDSDYYKWSNMAFSLNQMPRQIDEMLRQLDRASKPVEESEYIELRNYEHAQKSNSD